MPTRYLKPGIRDSELIDGLSPMAEILFYRLLVTVDDFGRFDARPAMIKSQCFPIREKLTAKACEELVKELALVGLIFVYEVDCKPYLQISKWDNVPRSKVSKFPEYADECTQVYTSVCDPRTVLPVTETETVTKTVTETKTESRKLAPPEGVSIQVWDDFVKSRKAKLTQTALDGIQREANKARWSLEDALRECCARGWRGFKADWVQQGQTAQDRKREVMSGLTRGLVSGGGNVKLLA